MTLDKAFIAIREYLKQANLPLDDIMALQIETKGQIIGIRETTPEELEMMQNGQMPPSVLNNAPNIPMASDGKIEQDTILLDDRVVWGDFSKKKKS